MGTTAKPPTLWTIGHSTHPIEKFIGLLATEKIEALVDVRRYPGSKRHPQFGQERLAESLKTAGIKYIHFPDLGGRRSARVDSPHTAWRNAAFRGYADYMSTPAFLESAKRLLKFAADQRTAIMCAETLWWQCHRGLIADWLKVRGHTVFHIRGSGKTDEHPFTSAASIVKGKLSFAGAESQADLPLGATAHSLK